jgi:hypothetical protein
MLGTVSAFAYRHRETEKNLCRDGWSQDLPNTGFQLAVWHLNKKKERKQQCTHSTTKTHKITTHTRQLQQQCKLQLIHRLTSLFGKRLYSKMWDKFTLFVH